MDPLVGTDLTFRLAEQGEHTILEVRGEIDAFSAPQLRDRLRAVVRSGTRRLVIDLQEVTFLDSTGLGVLVGALRRLSDIEGTLSLVCTRDPILKVFHITALDQLFSIHGSTAAATDLGQDERCQDERCQDELSTRVPSH